jgi:hypothetical protein
MTDDSDPGTNLEQWQSAMRAEHEDAIENPDPDDDHQIEGVAQVNYRLAYEYDPDEESLVRTATEQVAELADPELLSCACGVRGMTREEAAEHIRAATADA